jgi:hypothetical protein
MGTVPHNDPPGLSSPGTPAGGLELPAGGPVLARLGGHFASGGVLCPLVSSRLVVLVRCPCRSSGWCCASCLACFRPAARSASAARWGLTPSLSVLFFGLGLLLGCVCLRSGLCRVGGSGVGRRSVRSGLLLLLVLLCPGARAARRALFGLGLLFGRLGAWAGLLGLGALVRARVGLCSLWSAVRLCRLGLGARWSGRLGLRCRSWSFRAVWVRPACPRRFRWSVRSAGCLLGLGFGRWAGAWWSAASRLGGGSSPARGFGPGRGFFLCGCP